MDGRVRATLGPHFKPANGLVCCYFVGPKERLKLFEDTRKGTSKYRFRFLMTSLEMGHENISL
jgi:hypothetical protein